MRGPEWLRAGDRIGIGPTTLLFNASPTNPLKFSDRPLPRAPDATYLPARTVSTAWVDKVTVADGTATTGPGETGVDGSQANDRISHIVSEVNRELFPHRSLEDVLEKVMDIVHHLVGYERGLQMLLENGEMVPKVRRRQGPPSGHVYVELPGEHAVGLRARPAACGDVRTPEPAPLPRQDDITVVVLKRPA